MNFTRFAAVALIALTGCATKKEAPRAEEPRAARVQTAIAESSMRPEEREVTGTVTAKTTAAVSSRIAGHIKELRVREGDTLAAGQTIAVIDTREVETAIREAEAGRTEAQAGLPESEAALRGAQAQLDLARTTLDRMTKLKDSKSITDQEFDETRARFRQAQSQVEIAQARGRQIRERIQQASAAVERVRLQQNYATVTSPFTGVVTEKRAEAGVFAGPGQPIVVMERAGEWRLDAAVDESLLKHLRVGTAVSVTLDAITEPMALRVNEILPSVDARTRTATVRVALPGRAGIRSGLSGRMKIAGGERKAILVPSNAVVTNGQMQRVFVLSDGRLRAQLVTAVETRDGKTEIVSGLEGGERIAAPASAALTDGARVEVVQ
ncbi:MAG: efflux RND transporter periplasmic adaptor subunit [Acidobacteria bacterium]|nr:efflux RND transporter periplasmic adaptor subunit [Acidobacteriota bacterium]